MSHKLTYLIALVFLTSFHVCSNGASLFDTENRVETMPSWFYASGSQRIRYETLNKQFRSQGRGSDQQVALRTLLAIGIKSSDFNFLIEAGDSRAFGYLMSISREYGKKVFSRKATASCCIAHHSMLILG